MAFFGFGKDSKRKRHAKSRQSPPPATTVTTTAATATTAVATKTSAKRPPPIIHYPVGPPLSQAPPPRPHLQLQPQPILPPRPMHPGWGVSQPLPSSFATSSSPPRPLQPGLSTHPYHAGGGWQSATTSHLNAPPVHHSPYGAMPVKADSRWMSATNLGNALHRPVVAAQASFTNLQDSLHQKTTGYLNQGAALCDLISSKLDAVITSIDGDIFSGEEKDLIIYEDHLRGSNENIAPGELSRSLNARSSSRSSNSGSNYFDKVWFYANSRLPPHLPPMKVYMPTYPLLCLAAQYSEQVYTRPNGAERETHIDANWRSGTKAMVLKSLPLDDLNVVVFAIRGSQTFMDWAVNFRPAPSSPQGFLDDPGNLCHSGFLHVARSMIQPVSQRLIALLQENPSRRNASLLITGHSAGGAVASLLYAHMLSSTIQSELTDVAPCFKRIHCVTFGAPPVSLLPLKKPDGERYKKCIFFSFVNEGDPVPRADKAIITSLLRLYAVPAPGIAQSITSSTASAMSKFKIGGKSKSKHSQASSSSSLTSGAIHSIWKIPPGTLSLAGRIILLRTKGGERPSSSSRQTDRVEDVEACVITDDMLRSIVFGDPVRHMMRLYARRIEILATRAVTARGS